MASIHETGYRLESTPSISDRQSNVNYITFNQDGTCAALGLSGGYRIYACKPSVVKCCSARQEESVGIVEMLFSTSLLAIVGLGEEIGSSPRRLKLLNSKRQSTICDLMFPSTILLVRLSRCRMIVLLEEQIYIYDIKSMNLLHIIETSPNYNLLCALSGDELPTAISLLAYPSPPKTITHESLLVNGINTNGGTHSAQNNIQSVSNSPNRVGDAIIFDLTSLQPVTVIEAHKSALSAMCLSKDGSLLATASDKGTIIRVFNVKTGVKLYQFRRGTYPTKIFSLSFSNDNKYIVATSSSETVHVFRLGEDELLANKQKECRKSRTICRSEDSKYQTIEEEQGGIIGQDENSTANRMISTPDTDAGVQMHLDGEDTELQERCEDENDKDHASDEDDFVADDGDDSDAEADALSDDGVIESSQKHRKLSQSSSNSFGSLTSGLSTMSGGDENREKAEPVVDHNRLSVARLIRRSSQHLGRKAAQKMGDYLPSRFSSILEPTRHFASLKLQSIGKDVKSIAVIDGEYQGAIDDSDTDHISGQTARSSLSQNDQRQIIIRVVTSEGYYYTYGLDLLRGGDCILLHQYYLLDE